MKPIAAEPSVKPLNMIVINSERRRSGTYSESSVVAFGIAAPMPMPASRRSSAISSGADDEAAILTAEHAARGVALAQYFTNQSVNLTRRGAMEKRQARLDEILAIVGEAGGSITLRLLRDNHGVGESELGQIVGRNPGLLKIETAPSGPKGGRRSPRLVIVQKK